MGPVVLGLLLVEGRSEPLMPRPISKGEREIKPDAKMNTVVGGTGPFPISTVPFEEVPR